MNDVRDDLRDLLRRRADDVPSHRIVPPSMRARARRRIALNALAVGLTVAVVAVGAFAGLRAFGAAPAGEPANQPTASVQPTAPGSTVSLCTSTQLRAAGSMEGAAGSREGGIRLTNTSDETCTLRGTPAITLLDENMNPITSGVQFESASPAWSVEGSPEPAGWPVVTVHPGGSAFVRLRWSNWCPDGRAAPLWRLEIPGGGTVDATGLDTLGPPPCNGQGLPSTIEEGSFEPGAARSGRRLSALVLSALVLSVPVPPVLALPTSMATGLVLLVPPTVGLRTTPGCMLLPAEVATVVAMLSEFPRALVPFEDLRRRLQDLASVPGAPFSSLRTRSNGSRPVPAAWLPSRSPVSGRRLLRRSETDPRAPGRRLGASTGWCPGRRWTPPAPAERRRARRLACPVMWARCRRSKRRDPGPPAVRDGNREPTIGVVGPGQQREDLESQQDAEHKSKRPRPRTGLVHEFG